MKKYLAILLTAALLLCIAPLSGFTAVEWRGLLPSVTAKADPVVVNNGECGEDGGNLTWTLDSEGTLTVSGTGRMKNYPLKMDPLAVNTAPWAGLPVKQVVIEEGVSNVGECAFYRCADIVSVSLPESVASIWMGAFSCCAGLTSVTIPDGVGRIGERAFADCGGLTSLTVGDGLDTVGYNAFAGCDKLETLTIGKSIEKVSVGDLSICKKSLKNAVVSDGAASLCDCAFSGYTALTSVALPESLKSVGERAFLNCKRLEGLTLPSAVETIGKEAFCLCVSLPSLAIPAGVTVIPERAFAGCTGLNAVSIPNTVQAIWLGAFFCCTALTSVVIPDSVTDVGESAFWHCESLTEAAIGNGVRYMGCDAFAGCDSLRKLYVGKPIETMTLSDLTVPACNTLDVVVTYGVKRIAPKAFQCYKWLNTVTLPQTVTEIGDSAFQNCVRLAAVNFPDRLIAIGEAAFKESGASYVKLPDSLTTMGKEAFRCCDRLVGVEIGNGLAEISEDAFRDCKALTYVSFGTGLKSIKEHAFMLCTSLPSAELPEGLESVWAGAFNGCTSLKQVTLPATLTTLAAGAFYGCTSLPYLLLPESLSNIGLSAFDLCTKLCDLYYAGSKEQWKKVDNKTVRFPSCYDCLLEDGVVYNKDKTKIQDVYDDTITFVDIPQGVTEIGKKMFCGCSRLAVAVIPASVRTVGAYAFNKCDQLKNVYYEGDAAQWKDIKTGWKNAALTDAEIHYGHCEHTSEKPVRNVLTAPTCTEPGLVEEVRVCEVCGVRYDCVQTVTPPLGGHRMVLKAVEKTATCVEGGWVSYACANCGLEQHEETAKDPTNHDWNEGKMVWDLDESLYGHIVYTCARCGVTRSNLPPKQSGELFPSADNGVMLGDVDGDGEITASDARLALRASVKLEQYEEGSREFIAGDANRNGVIESEDARRILRVSVKLESMG